ncbi:Glycosyl hydrolase family 85 [Arabidopsis thaliana]|uniref:mannosyl-glycoprotein endo-beta-N-acetylglucosaminidase n=2 Tax=Arabidopsis thaliana TaxID=3702 RepID=A0A1I9LSS7_ARATH|nr:Glycosyl hydrolase family 85 [Arabidopsis thaliana]ANM65635.1 Glycosyl hydrolase family 85 [Arabidopsis thaliana]|eukprot:NP_001327589.1 Glycosyl hydrolase family 85 [Arabidopsis thaliana]
MRELLRAYFSRRTLVSLYNLFFTLSRKLLTSFPLSLLMPKSNDDDVAQSEAVPLLDLVKPSLPISFPIKALQDLKSRSYFDSFHFQFNRSTVPFRRNSDCLPNRPRVLVCHDMKGGYVDDKWVQGCENEAGFAIWHWYLMDIFVYFSHSLVTIPPPCWTNTAHRHGVKVLGTFITEWDEGKATCKEMLATKESAQMYAERLAELATALGFDGWLINIENDIDEEQIPNMKEFVSHLKKVLHLSTPGALVIWYDSVTVRGNLQWQDQLTELNKPFFDLCDGIFMNYTWKESYPNLSAEVAGDRKFDVYMGIDVFGRGSFGGGQWTVNAALDLLKRNNVSAAIFAPGWVYETAQPPNFHTAQNKWWSLVEKSWGIVQTYPQVLPFYSDFNQGFGYHVSLEGRQLSDSPWYNISCQSLQPLLEFNEDNKDIIQVTVDAREASFNGGGNIVFRGKLKGDAYFTTRLFKPHLQLSSSPITISYSVKSDETSNLGILLSFSSPSLETKSILVAPEDPIRRFDDMSLQCLTTSVQTVSEWTVHEASLVMDGHTLTEISAFCYRPENSTKSAEFVALLGHISVKDHVQNQQNPEILLPASSWVIEAHNVELVPGNSSSKILRVKLEWRQKDLEDSAFTRYNVYAENVKSTDLRPRKVLEKPKSETVLLGIAHVPAYYVAELVVESDVKAVRFMVQACGEDASLGKLDEALNLLVDLEGLSVNHD